MEIKGFHVLPVTVLSTTHYLFFKKHESKSSISSRSLFWVNLPVETLTYVFKKYLQKVAIGATLETYTPSVLTDSPEDWYIDLTQLTSDLKVGEDSELKEVLTKLPKNCGVTTFVDKAAFQLAFNALKKLSGLKDVSKWPLTSLGSEFFLKNLENQILEPAQLTQHVSEALVEFNRAEKQSMDDLKSQSQLVDEDGFTLVVGPHRKTKAGIMGVQKWANEEAEKAQTKMKKKEKSDFYRYQLRQRKKEEMNQLLHKFKMDQEKVRLMKEKKRFRPY